MRKGALRFWLAAAAAIVISACTTAPLKPAAPISVPAGLSHQQVQQAVVRALEGRTWTLDNVGESVIDTTLHIRDHAVTLKIDYDTSQVSLHYVSSTNLNYRSHGGHPTIHRNYNGWVNFVEQDIRRNLQNSKATEM